MTAAHTENLTYELHSLGWKSFQDLCLTTVSEVLGQTVTGFLQSRDGGRDGGFHGDWVSGHGINYSGSFTVQCKHSSKRQTLSLSGISSELEKASVLAEKKLADNYILMTNMGVSGTSEAEIRRAFLKIHGINDFLCLGNEWITRKIRETPRLRILVPRVYGLGDLSQILDSRGYEQATEILSSLGDDLSKLVVTGAHTRAAKALAEHGFVLLLGEPAAGKSTIAASLAVGAIDIWKCSTIKIRNSDEFIQHWNPHEPKQFFWVDDAFGATQYQRDLALAWSGAFPHMRAAVRKGTKILFTSRDYIFRAARQDLKSGAFPLVNESQVVIQVQKLAPAEKQQILYNHIKRGNQPNKFKTGIKPFLGEVAKNKLFLPEIARRLGDPIFTKSLHLDSKSVDNFVTKPIQFLIEVVSNLDTQSRSALALIFMRDGALESPVKLSRKEEEALKIMGAELHLTRLALTALNSSLVNFIQTNTGSTWAFKHPTIGDAFAALVAAEPELLDIYMNWTSAEKMLSQVTCGTTDIEGATVIIPESRFDIFLGRLTEVKDGTHLYSFLATRCSRVFLALYTNRHPDLEDSLCEPHSYLHNSSKVALLVKLHEFKILPETWRNRFVARATNLALETPDVNFLSTQRIRSLFTELEVTEILKLIEQNLLPTLEDTISEWDCSDGDPEESFWPLSDLISTLEEEFSDNPEALSILESAQENLNQEIEMRSEDDFGYEEFFEHHTSPSAPEARSIFDDVDL